MPMRLPFLLTLLAACGAIAQVQKAPSLNGKRGTGRTAAPPPPVVSGTMLRIMPLGDSITQADCNHDSYRRALWHALQNSGANFTFVGTWNYNFGYCPPPDPDFDTYNQGQWGIPASSVVSVAQGYEAQTKADIVLLLLGSNDIANQQDPTTVQNAINSLGQIIDNLRAANPNVRVLMGEIPPCVNTDRNNGTTQLNALMPGLVAQKSTAHSPVSLVDLNTGYDPAVDAQSDGLHPNQLGEYLIAQRWFNALQPILGGSPVYNPAPVGLTGTTSAAVSVVYPTAGQTVSGAITAMAAIAPTLDAAGSYLMVDGQELGTYRVLTPPYAYPLDTTQLTNGAHMLAVWAHDTNNNTDVSASVAVTVNNSGTASTTSSSGSASTGVVLTYPAVGQTLSGLITVTATITPTLDAAGSYLMVDGQQIGSYRATNPPYSYSLDTTQLTNGQHTLTVWAHDTNNQVDLSAPVVVIVAN